jgi:hypothetical protein
LEAQEGAAPRHFTCRSVPQFLVSPRQAHPSLYCDALLS